ncbi:HesA/MoeB/ThiF family protein [Fontisphaera persica]|uniref:HesA/MoeB/ThiF family protein n=1 Tax=Fontisphaera persica TaxID=2974023 RepID=UPI0024BFF336|nr:HesA/MoeB/ThiF family protein [Fontisphaera persica]WCJ59192.1 HesA/MoeB/ThiF family protein [Fontisphaera persica]
MRALPPLTEEERQRYEWQLWVPGWGEAGQQKLKAATVLISRVGGIGGQVAYQLAAAGVGRLILAHAGPVRLSDLNRQLLMTHDWLGKPRVECAARRLRELNPAVDIVAVPENISEKNVAALVAQAEVVVDAAPLFEERFLMNREAVRQRKPMVECAMYDLTAHVTTILPGQTACLACLCPEKPPDWKREFPVVGAVSGLAGCLGAMEVCKLITGVGEPLRNRLLQCDLRTMAFKTLRTRRAPQCAVCGGMA